MASDDDEDGFITYGEPLDDDEDDPKKNLTAVENQVVKDRQGRRRFHGAFTGGFSAGYFNSVGSKEGWTPSTFVSSRSERTEHQKQTVEEYMDEEDLGEYGIAPRQIKTAEKFSSSLPGPKRSADDDPSVIPGTAPLEGLVTVTNSSIGAQILKKMGWREGQGVGPKVRKHKKKNKDKKDAEDGIMHTEEENYEERMSSFLFGPSDVQEFLFQMKSDQKGLGYSGISRDTSVLGGHVDFFSHPKQMSRNRKGIRGTAFGTGALEDPDGDIYSVDDMNMYDHVLGGDDSLHDTYGWTAPKNHKTEVGSVDGFIAASKTAKVINKVFPPPVLPQAFRPFHVFSDVDPPEEADRYSRFSLSSAQRSAMLGEELLPGKPDILKAQSKVSVTSESKEFTSTSQDNLKYSNTYSSDREERIQKQETRRDDDRDRNEGITEWERQRARSEVTNAAGLYKPVTSMMASRFVSAKYKDEEQVEFEAENQVDKSAHENAADMKMYGKLTRETFEWHPDNILCKRFNVPNPYPGSSLIGVPNLKREKVSVYNFLSNPSSLEETPIVPAIEAPPAPVAMTTSEGSSIPSRAGGKKKTRWDIKPAILSIIEVRRKNVTDQKAEDEEEKNEESVNHPPMDLFNAIFNETSSSESESSELDEEAKDDKEIVGNHKESPSSENVVLQSDTKGPNRGLPGITTEVTFEGVSRKQLPPVLVKCDSSEGELYGPVLPPPSTTPYLNEHLDNRSSDSVAAEAKHSRSSHTRHKKHHQSSKSKSQSKKHKSQGRKKEKRKKEKKHKKETHHRKQKKSRHDSDSTDSSTSEG